MRDLPSLIESKHLIRDPNFQFEVARLGQLALKIENMDEFMDEVVQSVSSTLDVEFCKILHLLPNQEELLLRSGVGWKEGNIGHTKVKAKEQSQAGFTLLTDQPVIVTDLVTETRFKGPDLLLDHGVRSGISVVIQGRDGVFGVLGAHAKKIRQFSGDHVNFLLSVSYILASAIDQQRNIEEIRKREANYKELIEHASDAILVSDSSHNFIQVNSKACELTGYSKDELLSMNIAELLDQKQIEATPIGLNDLQIGDSFVRDRNIRKRGGTIVPVEVNYKMISPNKFQAIVRDLTERKKSEEKLIRESKYSAFTHLAGGIAHDFNNLLNVIMGNISIAQLLEQENEDLKQIHTNIMLATKRAANITQQLLTFSREYQPEIKLVSINDLLGEVVDFTFYGSKNKPVISSDSDKDFVIEADSGQISQVLQNILINADQSIHDELGQISIHLHVINGVDNQSIDDPISAQYLVITVKDNGSGIPDEVMDHIFDPFFTTKDKGKGLGLSTSLSIIKNHHGTIDITSQVGKGTQVDIYLPLYAGDEVPESESQDDKNDELHLKGSVLILEDDELVLETLEAMLERLGLEVTTTKDGLDTIAVYQKKISQNDRINFVILDLTIPGGLGGTETLKRLQEIDPDVNAIVSSGYSKDFHLRNFENYGFKAELTKPYSIQGLYQTLSQINSDMS